MNNNTLYPFLMLLIIFAAIYFMYGDAFSPQQVNLQAYKEQCVKYQTAPPGVHGKDEVQMLVNEINYLLPKKADELSAQLDIDVKKCAMDLEERLAKNLL